MANILIRGMKMPRGCFECPFDRFGDVRDRVTSCWLKTEKGEKCPLVELPEGLGRLVDAREVLEKADKAPWFDGDVSELGLLLGSEVTTIVPAEGGSEDGN